MSKNQSTQLPFHDVGSIFPGEFDVRTVLPSMVREALALMIERRYSQLPVVDDGKTYGVFSLWSLAQHLATYPKVAVHDLPVADVMEKLPTVTVDDTLEVVLEQLEKHEAVLVASPHGLQAVATATDVLVYFFRIARPFVLLQEIERGVRELIQLCLQPSDIGEAIERCLKANYERLSLPLPTDVFGMSFEHYRTIICSKHHWPAFEPVLGKNKELISSKLELVRAIRNKIFHFRGDVTVIDHQTLAATRQWLLDKTRSMLQSRKAAQHE